MAAALCPETTRSWCSLAGPDSSATGASSSTRCALVPPSPKEDTPARRGSPLVSHGWSREAT